jgi:hypothetical protein
VQSTTDPILIGRPSLVASNWKFTAPPCFGASVVGISGVVLGAQAFTRSTLRHAQTLAAPEPLNVLVIDHSGALGRQHAGRGDRLRTGCAG